LRKDRLKNLPQKEIEIPEIKPQIIIKVDSSICHHCHKKIRKVPKKRIIDKETHKFDNFGRSYSAKNLSVQKIDSQESLNITPRRKSPKKQKSPLRVSSKIEMAYHSKEWYPPMLSDFTGVPMGRGKVHLEKVKILKKNRKLRDSKNMSLSPRTHNYHPPKGASPPHREYSQDEKRKFMKKI